MKNAKSKKLKKMKSKFIVGNTQNFEERVNDAIEEIEKAKFKVIDIKFDVCDTSYYLQKNSPNMSFVHIFSAFITYGK